MQIKWCLKKLMLNIRWARTGPRVAAVLSWDKGECHFIQTSLNLWNRFVGPSSDKREERNAFSFKPCDWTHVFPFLKLFAWDTSPADRIARPHFGPAGSCRRCKTRCAGRPASTRSGLKGANKTTPGRFYSLFLTTLAFCCSPPSTLAMMQGSTRGRA